MVETVNEALICVITTFAATREGNKWGTRDALRRPAPRRGQPTGLISCFIFRLLLEKVSRWARSPRMTTVSDLDSVLTRQRREMENGSSTTGDTKLDQAVRQWLQYDKVNWQLA